MPGRWRHEIDGGTQPKLKPDVSGYCLHSRLYGRFLTIYGSNSCVLPRSRLYGRSQAWRRSFTSSRVATVLYPPSTLRGNIATWSNGTVTCAVMSDESSLHLILVGYWSLATSPDPKTPEPRYTYTLRYFTLEKNCYE